MTIHSGSIVDGWTISGTRYGQQSGGTDFVVQFEQDKSFFISWISD